MRPASAQGRSPGLTAMPAPITCRQLLRHHPGQRRPIVLQLLQLHAQRRRKRDRRRGLRRFFRHAPDPGRRRQCPGLRLRRRRTRYAVRPALQPARAASPWQLPVADTQRPSFRRQLHAPIRVSGRESAGLHGDRASLPGDDVPGTLSDASCRTSLGLSDLYTLTLPSAGTVISRSIPRCSTPWWPSATPRTT